MKDVVKRRVHAYVDPADVFTFCYRVNDFHTSVWSAVTSTHPSIHPAFVIIVFFRFGAAIHSVGQRFKVKVTGGMNIPLHSGKPDLFSRL